MDADILVPITFLFIPIVAILSSTFLRYHKLKLQNVDLTKTDKEEITRLKERIHHLEVIVSENEQPTLPNAELQAQIDTLSEELRRMKTQLHSTKQLADRSDSDA